MIVDAQSTGESTGSEPPGVPSYPHESYAWFVFAVLVATVLLAYVDRQIVALLVEPLRAQFALSDTQIGLLQGPAFALFYAVAALPLGWAVDRGPRRNLLLAGLLLWSAATAACAYAQTYEALLLARIGVGIGEATLIPGVFSLLGDYFTPARRPLVFGLYMMLVMLGASLSMGLGGSLYEAFELARPVVLGIDAPWRLTFLSVAAPAPLAALLLCAVREPVRHGHRANTTGSASVRPDARTIGLLIAGIALAGAVFQILLAWFPTVLIRAHGWTAGRAGRAFGAAILLATLLAATIAILSSRRSARRNQPRRLLQVAWLAVSVVAPVVLLCGAGRAHIAVAAAGVVSVGVLIAYSLGPVMLQAVAPNRIWGRAAALVKLAEAGAIALGVAGAGALSDRVFQGAHGIANAVTVSAGAVLLLSAAAFAGLRVRSAGREHEAGKPARAATTERRARGPCTTGAAPE